MEGSASYCDLLRIEYQLNCRWTDSSIPRIEIWSGEDRASSCSNLPSSSNACKCTRVSLEFASSYSECAGCPENRQPPLKPMPPSQCTKNRQCAIHRKPSVQRATKGELSIEFTNYAAPSPRFSILILDALLTCFYRLHFDCIPVGYRSNGPSIIKKLAITLDVALITVAYLRNKIQIIADSPFWVDSKPDSTRTSCKEVNLGRLGDTADLFCQIYAGPDCRRAAVVIVVIGKIGVVAGTAYTTFASEIYCNSLTGEVAELESRLPSHVSLFTHLAQRVCMQDG